MENTDEKSAYQRLLKEFNRLEQKNDLLEEQLAKHKGSNAHKVRNLTRCTVLEQVCGNNKFTFSSIINFMCNSVV